MSLYRFFLRSFFQSDLIGRGGDPRTLAVGAAAVFSAPAVILCMYLALVSGQFNPNPELAFFLALSLVFTGLLAVVEWDELFPSRADFLILRPMPVSTAAILGAKLAAVATLMLGLAVIVNFYSNLLLPVMAASDTATNLSVLRHIGAQAVATAAASAACFLLVLAVKGLVLVLGGVTGRRNFGSLVRFALLTALFVALVASPQLLDPQVLAPLLQGGARHDPLVWFLGMEKVLAGDATPFWSQCARRAWWTLAATGSPAIVLFAAGCWVQFRTALALARPRPRRFRLTPWLAQQVCRPPRQRAVFNFSWATLGRSRRHRLYLSAWLGLGVAVALFGMLPPTTGGLLAAPLVLCFFLLLGLRHIFSIPIEPGANWIFRLSETGPQPERFGAASKLMLVVGVVPVALATLPFSLRLWGWRRGLSHAVLVALLATALVEVLLLGFRKLPFTCSYLPEGNAKVLWVAGWFAMLLYARGTAALERNAWSHPERGAVLWVGAATSLAALLWTQHRCRAARDGCLFDDDAEVLVQSLFTRD